MNKTDKQTLLVLSITITIFIVLLVFSIKKYENTPKSIERVRIDSISVDLRNPNLPDRFWVYHTKFGAFTFSKKIYSVGDSIEVQIIKIKK